MWVVVCVIHIARVETLERESEIEGLKLLLPPNSPGARRQLDRSLGVC